MKPFAILVLISILTGCQPARSDIFVEMVSPELTTRLISASATQTKLSPDSLKTNNLLWIKGVKLGFSDSAKSTTLWYDEQNQVTGMIEYQNGLIKDSIEFFPNGQRVFTLLFNASGKPSGSASFYYDDGRVRADGRYEEGYKTGIWREFKPDGKLEQTHEYDRYGNLKR